MLTNKHVVVAMLVAPILAIMAWFAVDYFLAERPHAAKDGATYALIAKPNCRYASGRCDLENAEFRLSIRPALLSATSVALTLTSSHNLDGAAVGIADAGSPSRMTRSDDSGREWQGLIPRTSAADVPIRVVVTARGAVWFAEIPTVFLETED